MCSKKIQARFPEQLLRGYRSFLNSAGTSEKSRLKELAEQGQRPHSMLIACCDSRAAPETIFDARAGELFVVRNIAGLVPEYAPDGQHYSTSAAIEFAVNGLGVSNIIVMGHSRCGGIAAFRSGGSSRLDEANFVGKWMSQIDPVTKNTAARTHLTDEEQQTALEQESIRQSVQRLRSFPYVAQLEKQAELSLYGAWFDISSAQLWIMDQEDGAFKQPVDIDRAPTSD